MKADSIGQAFCNGFNDRLAFGWVGYWKSSDSLYASWKRRIAWRAGWALAHLLTDRPLREPPMNQRARVSEFYCNRQPQPLTQAQVEYGEQVADRINVANMGGQPPSTPEEREQRYAVSGPTEKN